MRTHGKIVYGLVILVLGYLSFAVGHMLGFASGGCYVYDLSQLHLRNASGLTQALNELRRGKSESAIYILERELDGAIRAQDDFVGKCEWETDKVRLMVDPVLLYRSQHGTVLQDQDSIRKIDRVLKWYALMSDRSSQSTNGLTGAAGNSSTNAVTGKTPRTPK